MNELEKLKQENDGLKKELEILKTKLKNYENRGEIQKIGMAKKSSQGKHMSRVPFGYSWNFKDKVLISAQNSLEIEEIFEEFLQPNISLNQLSKKHNLSINGLKKILRNFAYIGKVKFDGQIHEGKHKPLVSSILFNKVQDKLDKIQKKKIIIQTY